MDNHQNYQELGLDGLNKTKVVVVMVPFPAQGHLNQLLHLCRLIMSYNILIHYACTAMHPHPPSYGLNPWLGPKFCFKPPFPWTSQSHLFFALNPTPIHKTSSLHISNHYSMLPCIFVSLLLHFYVNFHPKQEESLSSTTPWWLLWCKMWLQSQTSSHALSTMYRLFLVSCFCWNQWEKL